MTSRESTQLTVRAALAAPAALEDLRRVANWTVLQVHPDACNLAAEPDRLVALVRPQVGAGPFSVVVDLTEGFDGFAQPGEHVRVRGGEMHFSGLRVQLKYARPWQPRPDWEALRSAGRLARWLGPLADLLRSVAPPGSLAEGLPALLAEHEAGEVVRGGHAKRAEPGAPEELESLPSWPESGDLGAQVLHAAVAGGRALISALARADLRAAGQAATALAGLGAGLTPAGDDFLVGAMLALWSTAEQRWAEQAGEALAQSAGPRTNRLSRAWLTAAARGEAADAWHALVSGLIENEGPAVRQSAARIIHQGHTSGADALTGYIAVAQVVE